MANETPAERLDRVEARYRARFGGHPRVSRDPEVLVEMLATLDGIEADATPEDGLAERIATARDLYAREREAIVQARSVPGAIQAYRLRLWAELATARYRMSFAGKPRDTRDVLLLDDIRSFLGRIRQETDQLAEAAPHLQVAQSRAAIDRTITLCRDEAGNVRSSRAQGTLAEQGTRLAQLANEQFALYQRDFAGQSRLSRHPPRLERIVRALEELGAGMARLQREGFDSAQNNGNLGIVTERAQAYRQELQAMAQARTEATVEDRVNALGGAANRIFGAYREEFAGKSRSSVSQDRLVELFEALFPIALEMDAIDKEDGNELNEQNLTLVLDQLVMYVREWDAIAEAKSSSGS